MPTHINNNKNAEIDLEIKINSYFKHISVMCKTQTSAFELNTL